MDAMRRKKALMTTTGFFSGGTWGEENNGDVDDGEGVNPAVLLKLLILFIWEFESACSLNRELIDNMMTKVDDATEMMERNKLLSRRNEMWGWFPDRTPDTPVMKTNNPTRIPVELKGRSIRKETDPKIVMMTPHNVNPMPMAVTNREGNRGFKFPWSTRNALMRVLVGATTIEADVPPPTPLADVIFNEIRDRIYGWGKTVTLVALFSSHLFSCFRFFL